MACRASTQHLHVSGTHLPRELPSDVVVVNTFLTLRPPAACRRSRSCPPDVPTPPQPKTLLVQHLPLRSRVGQFFEHLDALGFQGRYDYAHLPTDTRTRMLKGYAFVNFPDSKDAQRCIARIEGTQLAGSSSQRTIQACVAAKQGVDANLAMLAGCSKKSRRRDAELPWVLVDGEMQPIQETARRLVLQ